VKINSIVVAQLPAHDVVNNEVIDGQAEGMFKNGLLHVRSLSASSAVATLGGVHLVDQTVDTNADVVVTLTGQWSVANAGNNAVAKEFIISLQPLD
jgi:threonine synthase